MSGSEPNMEPQYQSKYSNYGTMLESRPLLAHCSTSGNHNNLYKCTRKFIFLRPTTCAFFKSQPQGSVYIVKYNLFNKTKFMC